MPHVTIACDNSEILQTLKEQVRYNVRFPSQHLIPEADQISAIFQTVKSFAATPTFKHVHRHQDKATRTLTFLESLNVRADQLAAEFQLAHNVRKCRAPFSFNTTILLHINQETVTSKHRKRISRVAYAPALKQQLCNKHA